MCRSLSAFALILLVAPFAAAHGLLIPEEKSLPPLAMVNHKVRIAIDEQVAVTRVEQVFRNHTDRPLEATYVFPVPRGASVNQFTMWVDGKETRGELVEAGKARDIYTQIVRRTQDPGLLEYMGNNLLRMRVFPVPARGDQKVALSFTSVASRERNLVEYVYPLKTDGKATGTLEDFSITADIKSAQGVTNVFSPTHAITLKRVDDRQVTVNFDRNQGLLDKDFQLFYATGSADVGLTALTHRPISSEPGYVTLLLSPKMEGSSHNQVPRDMVLVLDTSGSMRGPKMDQARKALKYCLDNLGKSDRFGLINFATTVNRYRDQLADVTSEQVGDAKRWVEALEATGGTAINDALAAALDFRAKETNRAFTVVFFTDGQPTIGETSPDKILKNFAAKNTANTRVFTFGVGDDVNATMLDQLADQTRAVSTYVRPAEDIEAKVSGLYSKISNPVLTNLKLTTTGDVRLKEMYPPELPDLFYGNQLVVLARFQGQGATALKLTGQVGSETREFTYEWTFPTKTGDERNFVEHLWSRRKVGFLLDQIRANGEKKELVDEVVALAKKYGITTPYTSYLIVPDGAMPVAGPGGAPGGGGKMGPGLGFGGGPGRRGGVPSALSTPSDGAKPVAQFARENSQKPGDLTAGRGAFADRELHEAIEAKAAGADRPLQRLAEEARDKKSAYDAARRAFAGQRKDEVQAGKLGVDLSIQTQNLRNQSRLEQTASRNIQGRNVVEIGGVWIDEAFTPKTPAVVIKAQSDAYFRILERHAVVKDVFQLGNHLVWLTPNGTALVIDTQEGKEKLGDDEIDKLFVARK